MTLILSKGEIFIPLGIGEMQTMVIVVLCEGYLFLVYLLGGKYFISLLFFISEL